MITVTLGADILGTQNNYGPQLTLSFDVIYLLWSNYSGYGQYISSLMCIIPSLIDSVFPVLSQEKVLAYKSEEFEQF